MKQRNWTVKLVRFRKAGVHGKTKKAMRRAEKVATQKEVGYNG